MATRTVVSTDQGPKAVGPYSQAIIHGGLVFVSGQGPMDPAVNRLVTGDIAVQTERVLQNLTAILEASGSSMARVLKVTVFLKDMNDFQTMNQVYARYFPVDPPARTTVEAARLPMDILVEIDAIASVG
jgi:2-iminobutanoate/2-iminopropanoate deaminase